MTDSDFDFPFEIGAIVKEHLSLKIIAIGLNKKSAISSDPEYIFPIRLLRSRTKVTN